MTKRQSISARIVVESNSESNERTIGYVVSALKNACKNIRDGTVLITIYDEDDKMIGADMSGIPSEELQDSFDDMVDKLEQTQPTVIPAPRPPPGRQPAQQ